MDDVKQPAEPGHAPDPATLRALVDLAPDGIFVTDPALRITFVNKAGCRLLGYGCQEIIGMTVMDLVSEEDLDRVGSAKEEMLRGNAHVGEWRARRRDGTWVALEVHAKFLPDGQLQAIARDVSERTANDAERDTLLQKSESDRQWLRTLVETLPLAVMLFRPDGQVYFNRRTEALLGMTLLPDRGSAQYASGIHFPDGRPVPPDRIVSARVMRDGETVIGEEYLYVRPDGSRVPVLVSAAPLKDADGRVVGVVGAFQDMSEHMRLEQAVRANERLLQSIFDILPVGVWLADKTGRLVRANPAGERIWAGTRYVGMERYGEYKGWHVDTGKPLETDEWGMTRAIKRGETSRGELVRIQSFDGALKTILHSAAPLRDENGEIAGGIVVIEDITALHEAQEKQRASEQLMRAVIDLIPVGVWITDREGNITLANPAGERIWGGVRYVGVEGYPQYKAWWAETGEPIEAEEWAASRAIRYGETSHSELIRIQTFDGSFKTVINWAAPIRSDAGEIVGAVAVNEDVTSLMRVEEQLREAVRDREEILAIVSHDLRNPLNALMVAATAAERKARALPGGESVRQLAESLVDMSRRMAGLVDDLLAIAVAGNGGQSMLSFAPVAPSGLLGRAADAARPLAARQRLELVLDVKEELPMVAADSDRILRVLANLLDNALKFTTPPGRITLAAERTNGTVRFSVVNTGPALPSEQLETMFKPFWQAGRDRRGAGLGLSICRSVVEAHGGSIWAEPAQGQRVRVCFVLPRAVGM